MLPIMQQCLKFKVTNPVGIYATPANKLVEIAKTFKSQTTLTYNQKTVNLKSIMGVLSLGIPTKAMLEIHTSGEDEKQAVYEISKKLNELKIANIVIEKCM